MSDIPEEMVVEDGVRLSVDTQGRRKRHRQRRKRNRLPYEPRMGHNRVGAANFLGRKRVGTESARAQQIRTEMFTNGQPVAPYNTTQFLIEDHGDLQNIDAQLNKVPADGQKHSRTRDSSFSIDSDDDFFYSSPEDEEEFLTKEFSLEYQDLHVERLHSLPKADIIRDYLMLESKYEKALVELRKLKTDGSVKTDSGRDTDASTRSEVAISSASASASEQLRQALYDNRRLRAELDKVKRENAQLQSNDSVDSSVDSESDSSTSSSSVDSDSDSESPGDVQPMLPPKSLEEPTQDKKAAESKEVEMEDTPRRVTINVSEDAEGNILGPKDEKEAETTDRKEERVMDDVECASSAKPEETSLCVGVDVAKQEAEDSLSVESEFEAKTSLYGADLEKVLPEADSDSLNTMRPSVVVSVGSGLVASEHAQSSPDSDAPM